MFNRKIMPPIVSLILLLLVTGCANRQNYMNMLKTWNGSQPLQLVRAWGPPQETYELNGHQFMVYHEQGSVTLPGSSPSYQTQFVGNMAYTNAYGGSPATTVNFSCTTTFEVFENKIINATAQGNNCVK